MLTAVLAFVSVAAPTPPLPIASSAWLQSTVIRAGELTKSGKFDEARTLLARLADRDIKIEWHDELVPTAQKADLAAERDLAIKDWQARLPAFKVSIVPTGGDFSYRFFSDKGTGALPSASMDSWVPGYTGLPVWLSVNAWMKFYENKVTFTDSTDPAKPLLTAQIPVGESRTVAILHNDIAYCFGRYLGMSDLIFPGFLMSHADTATDRLRPHPYEYAFAVQIFNYVEEVRRLVNAKSKIDVTPSKLDLNTRELKAGPVLQGTHQPLRIEMKNVGGGPLGYMLIPDCSCFTAGGRVDLKPGQSTKAEVTMDTTEFGGVQSKKLYLITNDPEMPITEIPVEMTITDRYRFIPDRGQVFIVPDEGMTVETFLVFPNDKPMKITSSAVEGMPGVLNIEPWSGSLADPSRNEAMMERKGYRITLAIKDLPIAGRLGTTIKLDSDDPIFSQLSYSMLLQKGILASPESIYLGDISGPRDASFIVSRPGKPFKILAIESDSAHLKPEVSATLKNGSEYRVAVKFDGKSEKGTYAATLTVKTDDPKQPNIYIQVSANVR